jgi:hypothetical protein
VYSQRFADWVHASALTQDSEIVCWGWDEQEQSSAADGERVQVACGVNHPCGLSADEDTISCSNHNLGHLSPDLEGTCHTGRSADLRSYCQHSMGLALHNPGPAEPCASHVTIKAEAIRLDMVGGRRRTGHDCTP